MRWKWDPAANKSNWKIRTGIRLSFSNRLSRHDNSAIGGLSYFSIVRDARIFGFHIAPIIVHHSEGPQSTRIRCQPNPGRFGVLQTGMITGRLEQQLLPQPPNLRYLFVGFVWRRTSVSVGRLRKSMVSAIAFFMPVSSVCAASSSR